MPRFDSLFPKTFSESRDRFRALVADLGWETESFPLECDPSLSMDVALSDDSDRPLLVLSSGLHGVEGFFGSAGQQAFMQNACELSKNCRVLMLHALNPFGFEHLRRVNEDNIDLNRNFLNEPGDFSGSDPIYQRLDGFLNPQHRSGVELYYPRAAIALMRFGGRAITHAFVAGQYDYPQGIYFGGSKQAWLPRTLSENVDRWIGDSQKIIHLDFHTGLGIHGDYIMMMEPGCDRETYQYAQDVFADHKLRLPRGVEKAYQAYGNIGSWMQGRFAGRQYMYFCFEFGTFAGVHMLAGMREENRAYHLEGLGSAAHQRASRKLADLFVPRSRRWRERVIQSSLTVIEHSIGLLGE